MAQISLRALTGYLKHMGNHYSRQTVSFLLEQALSSLMRQIRKAPKSSNGISHFMVAPMSFTKISQRQSRSAGMCSESKGSADTSVASLSTLTRVTAHRHAVVNQGAALMNPKSCESFVMHWRTMGLSRAMTAPAELRLFWLQSQAKMAHRRTSSSGACVCHVAS